MFYFVLSHPIHSVFFSSGFQVYSLKLFFYLKVSVNLFDSDSALGIQTILVYAQFICYLDKCDARLSGKRATETRFQSG